MTMQGGAGDIFISQQEGAKADALPEPGFGVKSRADDMDLGTDHNGASAHNDNGREGDYHHKAYDNDDYFVYHFQNVLRNDDHRSSHDDNDHDHDAVHHDDRSYDNNDDYDRMDDHDHHQANHYHDHDDNDDNDDMASQHDHDPHVDKNHPHPNHANASSSDQLDDHNSLDSTSSAASGGPIVSPTLSPAVNKSSMSTGAVVGIVVTALLAILAALIAAFMIKRRRRRVIHRTSNTLFNPVNLDMQEASSGYPSGPNGGGGGYGTSSGYFQGLNGRDSVEPLNAAMLGASGISAGSGLGHSSDAGTMYPYESDPRYYRRGSTVLPPMVEGDDGSGAMMGYGPTRMDPVYLAYGGGVYGQPGDQQHDPQDEEAYMRYQQQLYQQQLQQDPHQQDLQAPVAYYDPTSGEIYYPDYVPDQQQQQQGYAPLEGHGSPRANDDEVGEGASSAAAARRISDTAMSSSSAYVDTESDAHNSKSAWPILHRSSLLSNTSSSAGNRNPQGLVNKFNGSTTIKVPVPEEGENSSAS
ncbi:hypothetical protein BGZ70_005835 [Mortierella alpina]|uniref:Uncharacterized protein n=1 Tax=Mortierella alpina TaxID=64518 RepID=A0A9P6M471_MORAP|nr:hypothetical protein BGZ70_005835 [Mortierella alpina]